MKKNKILLVEDTHAMQMVAQSLLCPIYELTCVENLAQAEKSLNSETFALLLLDVILPDGDGFAFCEKLRQNKMLLNLPIIFLTSKNQVEDRVRGFNLGADDYVVKPIEPNEFVARVKAKLLRQQLIKTPDVFIKDKFKINSISQKAYLDEVELGLTPIEFKLFSLFLKNEGQVYSRPDLKKFVWGPSIHLSDHTVDTHVSSLRKKLFHHSSCLKSVVKIGYVFRLGEVDQAVSAKDGTPSGA